MKKWQKMTEEQKKRVSEWRIWHTPRNKGKIWIYSEEYRNKIGSKSKWRFHTPESKQKIRDKLIWVQRPKEVREKIQKAQLWEKGNNRRWWIANKKYTSDWTYTLKRSIRERDFYTCRLCWLQQSERIHSVHHIDYNKDNCNPSNLITLCSKCHWKTGYNRDKWIKYFSNILLV